MTLQALRCPSLLEITPDELNRLGYTVFNMGNIEMRDLLAHNFSLADLRTADRVSTCLFIIESQMDVDSLVRPFGSHVENPSLLKQQYNIGPARSLPTQEEIAIQVPLDDSWFPWMGLAVTPLELPTGGNVHATAIYIRRAC